MQIPKTLNMAFYVVKDFGILNKYLKCSDTNSNWDLSIYYSDDFFCYNLSIQWNTMNTFNNWIIKVNVGILIFINIVLKIENLILQESVVKTNPLLSLKTNQIFQKTLFVWIGKILIWRWKSTKKRFYQPNLSILWLGVIFFQVLGKEYTCQ